MSKWVRAWIRCAAAATLVAGGVSGAQNATSFKLVSTDVHAGQPVGNQFVLNAFGCSGGNQSPALQWSGAPAATRSFVITLFDPDDRNTGSGWWHWVLYDVPAGATGLARGAGAEHSKSLPAGAVQGRTDLGTDAYHGPCPDKGDPPHHYTFTIYALNVPKLEVPADPSGAMVTETLKEFVLAKATLVARHGR